MHIHTHGFTCSPMEAGSSQTIQDAHMLWHFDMNAKLCFLYHKMYKENKLFCLSDFGEICFFFFLDLMNLV